MELQIIQNKIYELRGCKVMLDFDLAELYEVPTKALNQAVKRNIQRFPTDFMFRLSVDEWDFIRSHNVTASISDKSLKSQNVTASQKKRNIFATPYAFTEQGLAMLSGVLNSDKAIEVNISIMRAFVALRQFALGYAELNQKLENFMLDTNMQFNDIYIALTELAEKNLSIQEQRKQIGYKIKQ